MLSFAVNETLPKTFKGAVVLVLEDKLKLGKGAAALPKAVRDAIETVLSNSRYQGGEGEVISFPVAHDAIQHVVAIGAPFKKENDIGVYTNWGVKAGAELDKSGVKNAAILFETVKDNLITNFLEGVHLGSFRTDDFKTDLKAHQKGVLKKVTAIHKKAADYKAEVKGLGALMDGVSLGRELVNLPPNIANPDYMVKVAKDVAKLPGMKVEVFGEKQLEKMGLNLLLSVGKASTQESRLIVMKYTGDKKSKDYKCLVGKGVMFDTGGYNLKPTAGMGMMKCDMAGSAAVMGAMQALANRGSKVNVIGVIGTVMNMIDADGNIPSVIHTAHNGQTVEVMNTDAEGRLVLADAMSYTIAKHKPTEVIDIATLTGAIMMALGGQYAGLFTPNEDMAKALTETGKRTGERLWRMPLDKDYAAKPTLADLNNDGARFGGASTAAVFLQNFAGKTPWAHIDIAGVAMSEKIPGAMPVKGASGFGVRLFVDYLEKGAK
ncbi:MAG: leucyl aminopeptidase [Alphaproteobacteria bacterium]|nr:leucyl aminopeptidase [Alphaproteobacteria bacterium]